MAEILYDQIDDTQLPHCPEDGLYEDYFQDTLATIMKEISTLKHKAEDLILALRIRESSLPVSPTLKDVMRAWLKKQYNMARLGPPTWRLLVQKVAEDTGGADRALAMRIASRHPIGSTLVPKQDHVANVTATATQETYEPASSPMSNVSSSWTSNATTPTTIDSKLIVSRKQPSLPEEEEDKRHGESAPPSYSTSVSKSSVCSGKEENRSDEDDVTTRVGYSQQVSEEASLQSPNYPVNYPPNYIPPGFPSPPSANNVLYSKAETPVQREAGQDESSMAEVDGRGLHVPVFKKIVTKTNDKPSEPVPTHKSPGPPVRPQPSPGSNRPPIVQSDPSAGYSHQPPIQPHPPSTQPHPPQPQPTQLHPSPQTPPKVYGPLQPYKMPKEGGYHGHALIINNINIVGRDKRLGAEKDDENLESTFNTLGYRCHTYRDKSALEMDHLINDMLKNTDHSQSDSFVICLLSHGDCGKIFGADDQALYLDRIKQRVINCPSLVGKPKLFILQACRGGYLPGARAIQSDDDTSTTNRILLPDESDLFFGYATTPNTKACRFTDIGSWYIIELCRALTTHYKDLDLLTMVQVAHHQVATKDEYVFEINERTKDGKITVRKYKQSPQMVSTLIRPVRF